jgi:hypothetical protein
VEDGLDIGQHGGGQQRELGLQGGEFGFVDGGAGELSGEDAGEPRLRERRQVLAGRDDDPSRPIFGPGAEGTGHAAPAGEVADIADDAGEAAFEVVLADADMLGVEVVDDEGDIFGDEHDFLEDVVGELEPGGQVVFGAEQAVVGEHDSREGGLVAAGLSVPMEEDGAGQELAQDAAVGQAEGEGSDAEVADGEDAEGGLDDLLEVTNFGGQGVAFEAMF